MRNPFARRRRRTFWIKPDNKPNPSDLFLCTDLPEMCGNGIECPVCHAPPGTYCESPGGPHKVILGGWSSIYNHFGRLEAWRKAQNE